MLHPGEANSSSTIECGMMIFYIRSFNWENINLRFLLFFIYGYRVHILIGGALLHDTSGTRSQATCLRAPHYNFKENVDESNVLNEKITTDTSYCAKIIKTLLSFQTNEDENGTS